MPNGLINPFDRNHQAVTLMQDEQFYIQPDAADQAATDQSPTCCGTGCTVCVLDYPELFAAPQDEAETLALLAAIEQAQRQVELLAAPQ